MESFFCRRFEGIAVDREVKNATGKKERSDSLYILEISDNNISCRLDLIYTYLSHSLPVSCLVLWGNIAYTLCLGALVCIGLYPVGFPVGLTVGSNPAAAGHF